MTLEIRAHELQPGEVILHWRRPNRETVVEVLPNPAMAGMLLVCTFADGFAFQRTYGLNDTVKVERAAEPVWICRDCDKIATRFIKADDNDDDPLCEGCYEHAYTSCGQCNRAVRKTDIETYLVARQTNWEPAEYSEGCPACCPEPSEDDDYDNQVEGR